MPAPTVAAPGNLWQFLGERADTPFQPFQAQAEVFSQVRIPWPGFVRWQDHPKYAHNAYPPVLADAGQFERRPDGLYIPYPTVHALNCGRRFGKTTIGEKVLWQGLLAPDDPFGPPVVRMTADTEEHARKIWDRFIRHLTNTPLRGLLDTYSRDRELVILKNGASAQMISANNPDALSGDGVTLWVIDEMQATQFTQAAWDNLFPSTAERNGVIVALGVCENAGPYRMLSFWGKDTGRPEFHTVSFPTASNPFVPRWRIDLAARTLAPTKFKQLYLAQWVGELGQLFRGIEACTNQRPVQQHEQGWSYSVPPQPNRDYYAGIDLGHLSDWTVVSVWRPDGELVAWDRFSVVDWEVQKQRARALLTAYGLGNPAAVTAVMDSTGIGDPIYEDWARSGLSIIPFQIGTNAKKRALVDSLVLRVGAGAASFPRVPELIDELTHFEATRSEAGVIQYSAPGGMHDDWVLSAALANHVLPAHNLPAHHPEDNPDDLQRQVASWESI